MPKTPPSRTTPPHPRAEDLQKTLEQGNRLLQNKQYKEATAVCERYLTAMPDDPDVLNLAGTISFFNHRLQEAVTYFRRAVQIKPGRALFHFNLANSLSKTDLVDEAIANYIRALKLAPNNQQILAGLGDTYARSGNTSAATQIYERLMNINPDHPAALSHLEQFYKIFLESNSDHIPALKNLGIVLIQKGKLDEAKKYLSRASRLAPNDIDIQSYLARVYFRLGEPEVAESIYRETVKLAPDNAFLRYDLGITLNSRNRTAEAITCLREAIRLDPAYAHAHEQLARIKKHTAYDDDMRVMEEVSKYPTLDTLQRSCLHFGLGKAYEDLREYDRAFEHYATGNELKRSTVNYNINIDKQLFSDIARTFNAELLASFGVCGHPDDSPIFIVGMPRSGTTLVEQILASHPNVHGAGEIRHLAKIVDDYFATQLNTRFPNNAGLIGCQTYASLGEQYCEALPYHGGSKYIINKMPHNFLYIGMIRLMLPNAKIIHCTRNPLDTCFSCYANNFTEGQYYSNKLGELGQYYGLYHRLMQHWRQLDASDIIEISYEDLINDQENQTRRLLDACGLAWHDACLDFHKSDRPVMTASVNQVRNGLYTKSVQRWRHFESHLTPLIDALGAALPDIKNQV